jgi:hypothetical protein
VRERLAPYLAALLVGSGVPWRREPACPAAPGYLSLVLRVEPAAWFEPRASAYTLAVQVGQRRVDGGAVRADPPDAFDLFVPMAALVAAAVAGGTAMALRRRVA